MKINEEYFPLLANWHMLHLFERIIPMLKNANVTDEQINNMLVDNLRRLFAGE